MSAEEWDRDRWQFLREYVEAKAEEDVKDDWDRGFRAGMRAVREAIRTADECAAQMPAGRPDPYDDDERLGSMPESSDQYEDERTAK